MDGWFGVVVGEPLKSGQMIDQGRHPAGEEGRCDRHRWGSRIRPSLLSRGTAVEGVNGELAFLRVK
jgi:hypothetical protein